MQHGCFSDLCFVNIFFTHLYIAYPIKKFPCGLNSLVSLLSVAALLRCNLYVMHFLKSGF